MTLVSQLIVVHVGAGIDDHKTLAPRGKFTRAFWIRGENRVPASNVQPIRPLPYERVK